ncbi:MAG: tetratricopeptide repeat protein, partial [Chloroflexota bacterium]
MELGSQDGTIWTSLGVVRLLQEKFAEAEVALSKAVELDPQDGATWAYLGGARWYQDKNAEAEAALSKAVELESKDAVVWADLGRVQLRQDKNAEAEAALSKAVELAPQDAENWAYLGLARLRLKKYAEAEAALSRAVELGSQDGTTWTNLGVVRLHQEKYAEAEVALSKAVELDPKGFVAWYNLGMARLMRHNYLKAVEAAQRSVRSDGNNYVLWQAWLIMAQATAGSKGLPVRVLAAYRQMAKFIERIRQEEISWEDRLEAFQNPAQALQTAADFALKAGYVEDALDFALRSKARTMGDLVGYKYQQWLHLLPEEERKQVEGLDRQFTGLEAERHGWRLVPEFSYRAAGIVPKQFQPFPTVEDRKDWESRRRKLEEEWVTLERHIVANHPEIIPYMGTRARPFRTFSKQLRWRLHHGQGVLEFLRTSEGLLAFFITRDGIVEHHRWATDKPMEGEDGHNLKTWEKEVVDVLALDEANQFPRLRERLTSEVIQQWGRMLYSPFAKVLEGIDRLWVSPHFLLAQVPFPALPFPDGRTREVVLLPSAAFVPRRRRAEKRLSPRFNLGVVAADGEPAAPPLILQGEEVRRLRDIVSQKARYWELAGLHDGEEPTIAHLRERTGSTKCLVLSCHGRGPEGGDLGALTLGTRRQPEVVTGKALLGPMPGLWRMQANIVLTSACLTAQVEIERAG